MPIGFRFLIAAAQCAVAERLVAVEANLADLDGRAFLHGKGEREQPPAESS